MVVWGSRMKSDFCDLGFFLVFLEIWTRSKKYTLGKKEPAKII